jgi:hypothetical protein
MGQRRREQGGMRQSMQYFSSHLRQMDRQSFCYWHSAQMEETI